MFAIDPVSVRLPRVQASARSLSVARFSRWCIAPLALGTCSVGYGFDTCNLPGLERTASYAVGAGPTDLVAVDANGDGWRDLLVSLGALDQIARLANDGAGGFSPLAPLVLPGGADPRGLAAGAFRGGRDLAVVERGAHRVRYLELLGGPDLVVDLPLGLGGAGKAAAGDLDGAGGDDLVVALEGDLFARGGGLVWVRDDGVAPLAAALLPAPPDGFERVLDAVLGDLDGDGDLDVAALRRRTAAGPAGVDGVLLWRNEGGGSLVFAGVLAAGEPVTALVAEDLDGDGADELVLSVEGFPPSAPGALWILDHDGAPGLAPSNFSSVVLPASGLLPSALAAGDVGGQGLLDFSLSVDVVAANFASGELVLYRAFDPLGADFAGVSTCATGGVPVGLVLAQLDADGTLDLVALDAAQERVLVALSDAPALTQLVGTGCAGTAGNVPQIAASGLPTFGNPSFAVTLSNGRPNAAAFLAIAPALSPVPLGFGCTLYLGPLLPLLPTSTSASGAASVGFAIPMDVPPFAGLDLFFQYAVLDPFGAYFGTYALSNALRIQIGS